MVFLRKNGKGKHIILAQIYKFVKISGKMHNTITRLNYQFSVV